MLLPLRSPNKAIDNYCSGFDKQKLRRRDDSGEWRVESGEWSGERGEWRLASRESRVSNSNR